MVPSWSNETRIRGGNWVPSGAMVRRNCPLAVRISTCSTRPVTAITLGQSRTGAATRMDRVHISPQPIAAASANHPRALPPRPASNPKPSKASAIAMTMNADHIWESGSANHDAIPLPSPTIIHCGSWARSASRLRSTASNAARSRAFQKPRARCGRGAPAMLGALIHCIATCKEEQSARRRKRE